MPLVPHPAPPSQIQSERISKSMTFQILRVSEHRQTKPASTVSTTNETNANNNGQTSSHDGRFRFIRVDRSYTRGRWGCSDYADSQLNQQIYSFQERSNPRPNASSIRCTHFNSGFYKIVGEPAHNIQEERSASSKNCCETGTRTPVTESPGTTHDVLNELTAHVVDECRITSQDNLTISSENHPVDKCIQSESKEISDAFIENSDESVQTTVSTVSESTRNTLFDMASFVANSDDSKNHKNSSTLIHDRPFDLQIHELNGTPVSSHPHMCLSMASSPDSPVFNSSNLMSNPPSNLPLVLLPNTITCDLDEVDRIKIKRLVNEPADVAGQILKELGVNMAENFDPQQGAQNSNQENRTPSEIDNKIEAAMDLVKNHLMSAVREEVAELKLQIKELLEKNASLEKELSYIRGHVPAEILSRIDEKSTESNQPSVNPTFNQ